MVRGVRCVLLCGAWCVLLCVVWCAQLCGVCCAQLCRIRVDVVVGDFLRPTRGVCTNQVLAVEGDVIDDPWVQVPPLCGALTGSHFYLHLRDQRSSPPLTVGAKMSPRHRTVTLKVSTRAATEPYRFVINADLVLPVSQHAHLTHGRVADVQLQRA
ncbi:hypothetical protein FHG87_009538 [Trinorchestia longiramus]|nr:hypothetical protein FHG87_009538 [Trinorchestia longiramus]